MFEDKQMSDEDYTGMVEISNMRYAKKTEELEAENKRLQENPIQELEDWLWGRSCPSQGGRTAEEQVSFYALKEVKLYKKYFMEDTDK